MAERIDGKTKLYGLIGHPVAHTFSPFIHNRLGELTGLNLRYVPFDVTDPDMIGAAVKGAFALNIQGMNVTIPYKQAVMPFLSGIDPVAGKIGAVNTLVRTDTGYLGMNTDYIGLKRALEVQGVNIPSYNAVIIGAGGAARAAAFMCGTCGVRGLVILNRTVQKAVDLAGDVKKAFPWMNVSAMPLSDAGKVPFENFLAIQCTKVGLAPDNAACPVEDAAFYQKLAVAFDCIYNPEKTAFLQRAANTGKKAIGGIDMLTYQAIASFEAWTGKEISNEMADGIRTELSAFIREQNRPKNVVLIGFMGSGKTTVGAKLSKKLGMKQIDLDAMIVEDARMPVTEIFRKEGENGFRRRETKILQKLIEDGTRDCVISTGGGIVVQEENQPLLKALGTVVLLEVSPDTVVRRLGKDSTRPLLQGPDRVRKVRTLLVRRQNAYARSADFTVDTNAKTADEVADEIIRRTIG